MARIVILSTIVFCLAYVGYWHTGSAPAHDSEMSTYLREFREVCREITKSAQCDKPVGLRWRVSWEPPTPFEGYAYAGVAPFYFLPVPQVVILDPVWWQRVSSHERKEVVWHEAGHALMGWHHSTDKRSLMVGYGRSLGTLKEAFEFASKENK